MAIDTTKMGTPMFAAITPFGVNQSKNCLISKIEGSKSHSILKNAEKTAPNTSKTSNKICN